MNLVYGQIVEVFYENGIRMGKVRVGGAMRDAPLNLLVDAGSGDRVLLCDGIAISKLKREENYVSGNSR